VCSVARQVHTRDLGANRVIVNPGVTRPIIPQEFLQYKLRQQIKSMRSRAAAGQVVATAAPDDPARSVHDEAHMWRMLHPTQAILDAAAACSVRRFFGDTPASFSPAPGGGGETLVALLHELRAHTLNDAAARATVERDHAELARISTLEALQEYPHARLLLSFFTFFAPRTAR